MFADGRSKSLAGRKVDVPATEGVTIISAVKIAQAAERQKRERRALLAN